MRRRRMRSIAKSVVFAWLFSTSLAVAQLCVESPAAHVLHADQAPHAVDTTRDHGSPTEPDDDCPVLPDAAVDSGSAEPAHHLPDAIAHAPVFHLHVAVDRGVLRDASKATAEPAHIAAYFVAHRLRL